MMAEPQGFTDEERALFDRLNIGKPGGLPLPSFIRPSEVVAQARPLADNIFADWASLAALVGPHEALLFDRWKNMKKKKRGALLKAAWLSAAEAVPDTAATNVPPTPLPVPHRPDLVAWRRREREKAGGVSDISDISDISDSSDITNGGSSSSAAAPENLMKLLDWTDADRAAFLWPNLSIEDLAGKARPLWLMATSRAAAAPHVFAAADLDTTRLGKACLALLPRYLNQYSMLFSGRTTPEAYGQLYTWEALEALNAKTADSASEGAVEGEAVDKKDEKESDPSGDAFATRGTHPGEGLWILTIQARLYRFLHLSVKAVLGTALASNGGAATAAAAKPASAAPVDDGSLSDTPVRSLEAPYRVPPSGLDLQALLDLTYAKTAEAEDHVWALRTDPVYLRTTLADWAAHRRERLSDAERAHPKPAASAVTAAVVDACLRRALEQAETWHLVYAKVQLLAQMVEKHAAAVAAVRRGDPGSTLPREVLLSFYALYHHIRSFENEPLGLLQTGAFASPPLRKHYRLVSNAKAGTDSKDATSDKKSKGAAATTVIAAAAGANAPPVVGDESGGSAAAAGSGPQQAAAVAVWALTGLQDDATRQLFGRQSLLDELEMAVRVSRAPLSPWVAGQVATLALYGRCVALLDQGFQPWAAAYDQAVQHDKSVRDILAMDLHVSMGRLRALLDHALGMEPPAFVVGNGTEEAAEMQSQLATFWDRVVLALELHKALTPRLREMVGRTALTNKATHVNGGGGSGSARSGRHSNPLRRVSLVDRRAARVFRSLFYNIPPPDAAATAVPAAVAWPDVVHALRVAGFTAERLYTSAWLFAPGPVAKKAATLAAANGVSVAGNGRPTGGGFPPMKPSLLQEPWTGDGGDGAATKLTDTAARMVGERLNRAYGWDSSTFVAE